jgi:superfamily II DNA or RNA helicase
VSIQLRDYQARQLSSVVASMNRGCKRNLLVLPTGGGKGAIASYVADSSAKRGNDTLITVHRRELLQQISENLGKYGVPHGLVAAGCRMQPWHHVQVALIGSLKSRLRHLKTPSLVIPDEAHHCRAASFEWLFETFPNAHFLGLTATPLRLDGRGLGKWFDSMHVGEPMACLIRDGYLSDYKLFAPPAPDFSEVHEVAGEFNAKELRAEMAKSTITGDAIRFYAERARGLPWLVRSLDIESSKEIAAKFCAAGIKAKHVDATSFDRKAIFDGYRARGFDVMCNVELAGEGVDIPGIVGVSDLRPTKSLTSWLQFVGRALRPVYAQGRPLDSVEARLAAIKAGPKPHAWIFDHVGNSARLGFPDDAREWSLEDTKRKQNKAAPVWTCQACFASFSSPHRLCPECGAVMHETGMGRAPVEVVDGKLEEVDREAARAAAAKQQVVFKARNERKRAINACKTLEELQQYAREHGYKEGWAAHILEIRGQYARGEKYRRRA